MRRVALVLAVFALSCRSAEQAPDRAAPAKVAAEAPAPAAPAPAAAGPRKFGEAVPPGPALTLTELLANPDKYASAPVTPVIIEAKVRRNCTRKGCWMELAEQLDPALPGCRVTFKDYGFFVPLDSAGATARVQGQVQVENVEAAEVAHLEGEGAKFAAKQADGTAKEVRVVASGVELTRDRT